MGRHRQYVHRPSIDHSNLADGYQIAVTHFLFPKLDFISSLAIAACLTPTDPVICASIVGTISLLVDDRSVSSDRVLINPPGGKFAEKHIPLNLRRILLAESATNDGLAYPFLTVSLYLALESSRQAALQKWFLIGCLCMRIPYAVLQQHADRRDDRSSRPWDLVRSCSRFLRHSLLPR